ncbi:Ada metal-binding domain-containing protein [Micromonospora chersina]|uniref:Ada metal-binding domain-containing protein n=1 Tax=Micromonospora chersina TaxID=47854 RepID=UPI0033DCE786
MRGDPATRGTTRWRLPRRGEDDRHLAVGHRVAPSPREGNVDFHPTGASAELAEHRACKRCSRRSAPGPAGAWPVELVGAFIEDGVVNRGGIGSSVHQLGRSIRDVEQHCSNRQPPPRRHWCARAAQGSRMGRDEPRWGHRISVNGSARRTAP